MIAFGAVLAQVRDDIPAPVISYRTIAPVLVVAGAAILGVLVSLDEVLLEILPIRRGTPDLATGNLFGTLAAFCSGVLGIAALVRPLELDSASLLAFLGAAGLYAIVATVFLARGRAWRGLGVVVLGVYAVWLVSAGSL